MRFVMVEIPDNAEANDFVKALQAGHVFYGTQEGSTGEEVAYYRQNEDWRVRALWAVPTKMCECPDYDKNPRDARSVNYGWYVHLNCARPRAGYMQHPFNLLEKDKPIKERVYYIGFRSDRRGWVITGKEDV